MRLCERSQSHWICPNIVPWSGRHCNNTLLYEASVEAAKLGNCVRLRSELNRFDFGGHRPLLLGRIFRSFVHHWVGVLSSAFYGPKTASHLRCCRLRLQNVVTRICIPSTVIWSRMQCVYIKEQSFFSQTFNLLANMQAIPGCRFIVESRNGT